MIRIREGSFDVVIVAGARVNRWPSVGATELAQLCADAGLSVGIYGGPWLRIRGVLPKPDTGGVALIEDSQQRVHRISARALVCFKLETTYSDPFPGWHSSGHVPLSTALRIHQDLRMSWHPCVAILGTGNRALHFGSRLLESGCPEVYCIESRMQWGGKRFAAWEVEKRRFEELGGEIIEAQPIKFTAKAPQLWELKLKDSQGVRVLEVATLISAGPFSDSADFREYPPGSALFEVEQTASQSRDEDPEGFELERSRARALSVRIIRALVTDPGMRKRALDKLARFSRSKLRSFKKHREEPYEWIYQGKLLEESSLKKLQAFSGVPQSVHMAQKTASIECMEEIACRQCHEACPESAIDLGEIPRHSPILSESRCTACGLCLSACPSSIPVLMHADAERSFSKLTLPWHGSAKISQGAFVRLLNRRGETLGQARVSRVEEPQGERAIPLVEVDVPAHLLWEARAIQPIESTVNAELGWDWFQSKRDRVEVFLDGEKRLASDKLPISLALFEMGSNRAEDALLCGDGSCGLCFVEVDGRHELACQERIRQGMSIRLLRPRFSQIAKSRGEEPICPCLGISSQEVREKIEQGQLQSPEAVIMATHLGTGKCHGQICLPAFRRLLESMELESGDWVDWRFPWSDWSLGSIR